MVARCPIEWQQQGGIDQCYLIHNRGHSRSFTDARSYCRAHGGDLAIVGSADMRDWLVGAVAETGDVGQDAYMWVGAQLVDDTWKWIEIGIDVDTSVTAFEDTGEGNCAAFTLNGKLIKQDCSQQLKFICHRNISECAWLCLGVDGRAMVSLHASRRSIPDRPSGDPIQVPYSRNGLALSPDISRRRT
ncbi:uncharacterized protein [Procambarus clarkii]|uniref:uncharacterized protein n=1 Tax=Procambarus clarkii TaxID=6728 RepID=UPI00374289FB